MCERFTPGPYYREGRFVYALNDVGTNRFNAQVTPGWVSRPWRTSEAECEAVAALFQAAPDLREAAEVALECLENNGFGKAYAEDLLRAALGKTRGETP